MRNKRFISLIIFFLSVSIIFNSCSQQKSGWQGTIKEVDGLIVVKNPIEPVYKKNIFQLQEELSIGKSDNEKDYIFENVSSVAVDNENNIYVVDNKACMVRVFTENGIHLRDIGRRGQGPGEFFYPVGIQITSDNELCVSGDRYLIFFSLEGEYKRRIHVTFHNLRPMLNSQGNIISRTDILGEKKRLELNKYNKDGEKIITLVGMEIEMPLSKYDLYYHFICYTVLKDDTVVWALNKKYELMFINQKDELYMKVEKKYSPIKLRQKSIDAIKRNQKEDVTRTHIIPEFYPPIYYIHSDDEGKIYVNTYEVDLENRGYYDVFNSEGKYITKIILKDFPACWHRGKLYTIEADEDGFKYVQRYKVTWNY